MANEFWVNLSREGKIAWVRKEAGERRSASNIGAEAGVTRNTIIGLGSRAKPRIRFNSIAGTGWRTRPAQRMPKVKRDWLPGHASLVPIAVTPLPPMPIAPTEARGTIETGGCRFPMFGDDDLAGRHDVSTLPYCGAETSGRRVQYCDFHKAVMNGSLRVKQNGLANAHGSSQR